MTPSARRSAAGANAARFMLDTETCSCIMKRSHPLVLKRLQALSVDDVCISVVTKAELLYGVELSPRRAHDSAALAAFLPYVDAVALDEDAAPHYAEIRADLRWRGAMIGANDLLIAAHARALGLTLVTNNVAEFDRVDARNAHAEPYTVCIWHTGFRRIPPCPAPPGSS